jgi:hypothetical protein
MESFMWDKDVEELGVGHAARNIVLLIKILKLESDIRMRKTITTPFVVKKKQDSNRKSIALVVTVAIVENDGIEDEKYIFSIE